MSVRVLLVLVLLAIITACDSDSSASREGAIEVVEFQILASGSGSGANNTARKFKVITSQEEYERELSVFPQETASLVDFDGGLVLFASYGTVGDNARSIEVVSVEDWGNYSVANISLSKSFSCDVGAALTSPYQFIYVPSSISRPVLVVETLVDFCQ